MTNEEKARAYDEALDWMRKLYPTMEGAVKEDAEHFFPALKESEDERIYNLICSSIKNEVPIASPRNKKLVLAYLERQKDSKVVKFDHDREQKPVEWSDDIIRKAVKEVGLTQHQIDWFKTNVFPPKQEWSEEDKEMISSIKQWLDEVEPQYVEKEQSWLDNLPERFNLQPKQGWSDEDERQIRQIERIVKDARCSEQLQERIRNWFKSPRPQPKGEIYKSAKHGLAIRFMNYLDENRPNGKMSLSNGECEDIDKAFKENDLAKIMRYVEKCSPSWKPSEEQMNALERTTYLANFGGEEDRRKALVSLHIDLKKLM